MCHGQGIGKRLNYSLFESSSAFYFQEILKGVYPNFTAARLVNTVKAVVIVYTDDATCTLYCCGLSPLTICRFLGSLRSI